MHVLLIALLTTAAWSDVEAPEPSEGAMREAFAADLSQGVRSALAFVAESGGAEAIAKIHAARTDAFEIRRFQKTACSPIAGKPGHACGFAVEIDTVAGPIVRSLAGRFFIGPCGLAYAVTARDS